MQNNEHVYPDHFTFEVGQRAAGIAAIDGGVGLDVVVIRTRGDIAVAGRDDAGRHRTAEAERVADRDYPFAQTQLVRIAELHRHQRLGRLEFQNCEVGPLVDADQFGLELAAVIHDDADLVGVRYDVIVGDHNTRGVDNKTGTERVGLARLQFAVLVAPSVRPGTRATAV